MPIYHQSTDSIQTDADGVDFVADNETLIIDPGVLVQSETAFGVGNDGYANGTLINHGFIDLTSGVDDAVGFAVNTGNVHIFNAAGAEIYSGSSDSAILISGQTGGSHAVTNHGDIIGSTGIGFAGFLGGISIINNYGYIHGFDAAVVNSSDFAGVTIRNFHTILGNNDAVYVWNATASDLLNVVYNAAGALLEGGQNAVDLISGKLHLKNDGTVIGDVSVLDGEKAVIINRGEILGDVHLGLGGGNDFFDGTGGTSGAIFCGGGNDRIIAGKANVNIHVGGGSDLITGGPGADRFIFDAPLAGQIETITNFHPGDAHKFRGGKVDKIVLSESDFPGIVPGPNGHALSSGEFYVDIAPKNASAKIVYDSGNGFLYFSPINESGLPQQHIHFATISPHLALTYGDFLVVA